MNDYHCLPKSQERRFIFRTELDEVIGVTGAKRGGRLLVDGGRQAKNHVISMTSIATGEKWFRSFALMMVYLLIAACNGDLADDAQGHPETLTSLTATEKLLTFQGQIYSSAQTSSSNIKRLVQQQARSAFGPLRYLGISVDDREFKDNVNTDNFNIHEISVVSAANHTLETIKLIRYTYQARALVEKSLKNSEEIPLTLLMPPYTDYVPEILKPCVVNYERDQVFDGEMFWFVFAPQQSACQNLIDNEIASIKEERQQLALASNAVGPREHQRHFLPVKAVLSEPVSSQKTSYPEYEHLFHIKGSTQPDIRIMTISGQVSHADAPQVVRYENDIGFSEFISILKLLNDRWPSIKVMPDSRGDPLVLNYQGKIYSADLPTLHNWLVLRKNFPPEFDRPNQKAFRRAWHDVLSQRWLTLAVRVNLQTSHGPYQRSLEFNLYYSVDETPQMLIKHFKYAFAKGDVVTYNGHSYIGSGPLDPKHYSPSDFAPHYQIFFFNSCVSFNYYGRDFFKLKPGGSQYLDLVLNGTTAASSTSGKAVGQFLAALFNSSPLTWSDILKRSQVTVGNKIDDPLRAIDGEQDNQYDPGAMPWTLLED